jgi:hypothetical protein
MRCYRGRGILSNFAGAIIESFGIVYAAGCVEQLEQYVGIGVSGLSLFLGTLLYGRHGLPLTVITIQQPLFNGMKTSSGFARFAGCQPTRRGVFCLAFILGAAMFAAGCGNGKNNGPAANVAPPPQTNQAAAPSVSPSSIENPQPAPAAPMTNASSTEPNLQQLNRALIGYIVRNHHRPKTFEEFAANANIQIPPPPAGKKYALNQKGYIILVDSSTN